MARVLLACLLLSGCVDRYVSVETLTKDVKSTLYCDTSTVLPEVGDGTEHLRYKLMGQNGKLLYCRKVLQVTNKKLDSYRRL